MKTHHENTANQIHGDYRWRTFVPGDLSVTDGTLQEAADAMQIDPAEIEEDIEEFGRCDTPEIVCWKPGDPEYNYDYDEPLSGGFEWPVTEAPSL
jgi:hypothetical protein